MLKRTLTVTAIVLTSLMVGAPAYAENELEKGIRHDVREVDKGVDHDAKEVDKVVKHDDKELEKGLKHDAK